MKSSFIVLVLISVATILPLYDMTTSINEVGRILAIISVLTGMAIFISLDLLTRQGLIVVVGIAILLAYVFLVYSALIQLKWSN